MYSDAGNRHAKCTEFWEEKQKASKKQQDSNLLDLSNFILNTVLFQFSLDGEEY